MVKKIPDSSKALVKEHRMEYEIILDPI